MKRICLLFVLSCISFLGYSQEIAKTITFKSSTDAPRLKKGTYSLSNYSSQNNTASTSITTSEKEINMAEATAPSKLTSKTYVVKKPAKQEIIYSKNALEAKNKLNQLPVGPVLPVGGPRCPATGVLLNQ